MKENMTAFTTAWQQFWAQNTGDGAGAGAPLALADTPAYPLARTVAMPPGHAYATGAVSFRMTDLQVHGLEHLLPAECRVETEGEQVRIRLVLAHLRLLGRYALQVKPDPIIDVDTAGNLMDLPPEACRPMAAGADAGGGGALDPQKEEWLNQAREQQTKLQQTQNGTELLSLYYEHNDIYDTVFRTNQALIPLWQAGGATREMAGDTSDAVKNDSVVNSADKTYTGGVSYNSNAFAQHLNVASACVWTDPDFDPMTGPPPGSKYWAAAKAALSFGKGVSAATNNTKNQVQEMNPSQVHATVDQTQGLPPVTDAEMQGVVAMGIGPGGAAAGLPDWIAIDEEDRRRLRFLFEATMKQKAEDAAIVGQPLFAGSVTADIGRVEATVQLGPAAGPPGQQGQAPAAHVELPAFQLDIDDSAWTGEVAGVARQRLESMYFIRSLLHEALVDRLQQSLPEAAAFANGGTRTP